MTKPTIVEITIKGGTRAQVEGVHSNIARLLGDNSCGIAPGFPVTVRERQEPFRVDIEKGVLLCFFLANPDGSFPYALPVLDETRAVAVSSVEYFLNAGFYDVRIQGENLERVDGVRLADPLPGVSVSYASLTASSFEIYLTDWRFIRHPPFPDATNSRLILTVAGDDVHTTTQTIYHQEPN